MVSSNIIPGVSFQQPNLEDLINEVCIFLDKLTNIGIAHDGILICLIHKLSLELDSLEQLISINYWERTFVNVALTRST